MYHMYSLNSRFHSIIFFYFLCLLSLLCLNILATIFQKNEPIINKFNFKSTTLYNNPLTKVQHSSGELNLNINYEPCFDWNTNLIFSWISVTYITKIEIPNTTIIIWDRIMKRDDIDSHIIKKDKVKFKYPIIDKFMNLSCKDLFIKLHWEHMPVIGPIHKHWIPLGNYKLRKEFNLSNKSEIIEEYNYEEKEP